eukprot:scaffold27433_cov53-Cyclotella_meneghiniana.AAC.3
MGLGSLSLDPAKHWDGVIVVSVDATFCAGQSPRNFTARDSENTIKSMWGLKLRTYPVQHSDLENL